MARYQSERDSLYAAGANPKTEKGRRRYRKLRRQAEKRGLSLQKMANVSLGQERYQRIWPQLKPGTRVTFCAGPFLVGEVLHRVGHKKVKVRVLGYQSRSSGEPPRGTLHVGDTCMLSWKEARPNPEAQTLSRREVAQKAIERDWESGLRASTGPDVFGFGEDWQRRSAQGFFRRAWEWAWWGKFGERKPYGAKL